jgi:CHAT domain-containing protein
LLGHLVDADEAEVELRLLSDAEYAARCEAVEDELIDQYLEGSLTAEERAQFERHFLKAPERKDDLAFAQALRKAARESLADRLAAARPVLPTKLGAVHDFFAGVYLKAAAVIVVALGVVLGFWLLVLKRPGESQGMNDLRAAYKSQRLIEPRVTGLDYAPLATTRGQEKPGVDEVALRRAELQLMKDLDEHRDAKAHHDMGIFYLAGRQFDKAAEQLRVAAKQEPNDARIHSDLGAALLESGKAELSAQAGGKSIEYFAESLGELSKAYELDGSLLEALYNRAIVHQYMMMPEQAEEDWRTYLEKDPNSKWADEARRNLKNLEEQKRKASESKAQVYSDFVNDYRAKDDEKAWQEVSAGSCRAGNYVVESLIDDYLSSAAGGKADEANEKFQMLRYVGKMKAQRAGDLYALSLAHFYESVVPARVKEINAARGSMRQGQEQIASGQFGPALESHLKAKQIFDRAGDEPESMLAAYWVALCEQQLNNKEQSAASFQDLERECEREKYEWLRVRALNGLAAHQALLTDYSKAIRYSLQAQKIAGQAVESYGRVSAQAFLMQAYLYLGNRQQSLSYAQQLLSFSVGPSEPRQAWMQYNEVAWALSSLGFHAAAVDYQKIALRVATELQEPALTSLSFARLGVIYGNGTRYNEAFKSVQQALKITETYHDQPFAQSMSAYIYLQRGNLYRQIGDFDEALASYNSCIDIYGKLNSPTFVYQARKGRLLALIAANDIPAAKEELDASIELYEKYRSKIVEESNRDSFFNLEQEVYDIAIDFEYSILKEPAKAFEYSELSRARSLLDATRINAPLAAEGSAPDLIFATASRPYDITEIQAKLPEQVQIVQYAVLENKILIWVFSRHEFRAAGKEIASKQLNEKIQEFQQAIWSQDQEGTLRVSRDLFGVLIQPIEPLLDRSKKLFIVPDKNLSYVPFGALVYPDSDRYLIENYLLATTPSSNMFLACTQAAQEKGAAPEEQLLAVGDATFDREEFPGLPDLPSAGKEAEEIASLYGRSSSFVGRRATKRAVTLEMAKADVIHLATHSITDELYPLRSQLLLAKDPQNDAGVSPGGENLQSSEIYGMKFPRTRLVVLSACQTGGGRSFQGEGVMSLARPFIARGVPLVVSSLWPVESDATAELMISFHRYRKGEGLPSVEALRRAQLDMLHGERQLYRAPYYWAAFILTGGYAEL